jgi:hypothetical protein
MYADINSKIIRQVLMMIFCPALRLFQFNSSNSNDEKKFRESSRSVIEIRTEFG